jgi:hypothetical protein
LANIRVTGLEVPMGCRFSGFGDTEASAILVGSEIGFIVDQ